MHSPMTFTKRRRVFLMRHGSVTYFDAAGKPFLPETVPLNEQGREQATAAGSVFAAAGIHFDRVIVPDADLREAIVGAFEGIAPENKRFLGGESIGELMDRIHPAVDKLRQQPQWDTVLLVLHGGVNRAILSYALTGQRLFMGNLAQTAGCINALDVGEAQHDWVVRLMNFSPPSHLQAESRGTTMEALFHQYSQARGR